MHTNYENRNDYTTYPKTYSTTYYPSPTNTSIEGDRFVPFLAPFLLGGIAGAAIARPNYPYPAPYPYPTPYPVAYPVPYNTNPSYYSSSTNYYY